MSKKLTSGRWEARARTGGRDSRRLSRTFDRKADADAWEDRMRRQRQLGKPLEQEDVTLAEFMETYWELHALPNLATSTRASYRNIWGRHVLPRLGGRDLRELTPKVITRFRVDLEKAGVGTATVRKALALVQSILTFAVVEERLEFNPVNAVRKPRYRRAREPHLFLPAHVEAIRVALSPRDAALVSVLAYAGPRPEEALRLTWRDVGTEALHFVDTKRHRERWTPLLAPLAADLREWRMAAGRPAPGAPIFPRRDGRPWTPTDWRNWRRRTWGANVLDAKTGQRAWVGVAPEATRPRDLRSSYITVQVYAGVPLTTIARWCGTSVAMIEAHYAGVIANWDGIQIAAETQILAARGRSVDVSARQDSTR